MKSQRFDMVFLHPGGSNLQGLQGPHAPIGMVGLASYLVQKTFKVKIINLLLEKVLSPQVTDEDILINIDSLAFGIDLHWFVHAYEAIALAEIVKKVHPKAFVILGGLTSSFFAEEILEKIPFIDMIIRGEAEEPLRLVLENIRNGTKNFSDTPNIVYRKKGCIRSHDIDFTINNEILDTINFLDLKLVNNWSAMFYLNTTDYQLTRESNNTIHDYYMPGNLPFYSVYTGRGCSFHCSFCGGSSEAFQRCFNRNHVILRDPVKVGQDIITLESFGVKRVYIPHSPFIIKSDFHHKLLDYLEEHTDTLNIGFMFEDFPFYFDAGIHQRYATIFNPANSLYVIYIANVNEDVAKLNHCYVPLERIGSLQAFALNHNIKIKTCFTLGIPGENANTFWGQAFYIKKCREHDLPVELYTAEMHPASNLFCAPEQFQVSSHIGCFMDYYRLLRNKQDKSMILGYSSKEIRDPREQFSVLQKIITPSRTL